MWRQLMLLLLAVHAAVALPALADEVMLSNGGHVVGKWLDREGQLGGARRFVSEHGIRFKLDRTQIAATTVDAPQVSFYRARSPLVADTVAAQWQLAEWCRKQAMFRQRRTHLKRILELDPEHLLARRALGFSQVNGRWTTPRQVQLENGYIHHEGKWKLPQQVEVLEERRRMKEVQQKWVVNLRRWRNQLETVDAAEALARIEAIDDPRATSALEDLLRRDRSRYARLLYVKVLGGIPDECATEALLRTVLSDQDEEVFHACVDEVVRRKVPVIVKQFSKLLRSRNNQHVNRAAFALARLEDQTAIPSLIEALVTQHHAELPGAGRTSFAFANRSNSAAGSAGLFPTGPQFAITSRPRRISYRLLNQGVLDALSQLAGGVSFNFDQVAWRHWYSAQQRYRSTGAETLRVPRSPHDHRGLDGK